MFLEAIAQAIKKILTSPLQLIIGIAVVLVFMIFFLFDYAYPSYYSCFIADPWWTDACRKIIFPIGMVLFYCWWFFRTRNKVTPLSRSEQLTGMRNPARRLQFSWLHPLFSALAFAYIIYYLPVMPTKIFAKTSFQEQVKILNIVCVNPYRSTPSHTNVYILDLNSQAKYKLSMMGNLCIADPALLAEFDHKNVALKGRKGLFGKYVDELVIDADSNHSHRWKTDQL